MSSRSNQRREKFRGFEEKMKNNDKYFNKLHKNKLKEDSEPQERKSNTWIAEKYNVTIHCVFRFAQRVLSKYDFLDDSTQEVLAKQIINNLDFKLVPGLSGEFPFMDDYRIIVKDGNAITIKEPLAKYKESKKIVKAKINSKGFKVW